MEVFNENAMWSPPGDAAPVPAKDKLSTIIETVILGIDLLSAMAKRPWLKIALWVVKIALQSFVKQYCKPKI